MGSLLKRTFFIVSFLLCLLFAKAESGFGHYYDSINHIILSKSHDQFLGDMQVMALDLIDTLETVDHPNKSCFLSEVYGNLSLSYLYIDSDRALKLMNRSLKYAKTCDNSNYIIESYNGFAIIHGSSRKNMNLDSVSYYFEKAVELSLFYENDTILTNLYLNLARCYLYQNKNEMFHEYIQKSRNEFIVEEDSARMAMYYELWGIFYEDENPNKVLENYELSLKWSAHPNTKKHITILSKMVRFCRKTEQYKLAVNYYAKLYKLRRFDQIRKFNQRYDNLINEHEIQKSKDDLAKIELEKSYVEKVSAERERWNVLLTLGLAILLLGLAFYIRLYRNQQELGKHLNKKNKELEEAKKEALELLDAKTRFTDTISHELRTPLHGIIGLTSLLIDKERMNISDEGKSYLDNLKYSGEYLLSLINDVLEMSKIDSNVISLEDKSFHFEFFISNLSSTFKNLVFESNNEFLITLDPDIPKYIKGDPIRLSQILINLIGNALKFTKNGKVELNVSLVSEIDQKVKILFKVIDNGRGIPKEKQKLIFDKFIQIKNDSSILNGTGLGLSIVKDLLQLYKSDIKLTSEVNKGTTFFFEIDFKLGEVSEVENLETNKDLNNYGFERGKVLIIDDNEINLIVSKNILENDGYLTETCLNGFLALEKLKAESFDLILLDLHMPKMDGIQTVKAIREINPEIPVILITASNVTGKWKEYKSYGFNDFIVKPYDKYDFLNLLMKYLNQK